MRGGVRKTRLVKGGGDLSGAGGLDGRTRVERICRCVHLEQYEKKKATTW